MKKLCLAYGRNLDLLRMKEKCPHCALIGQGILKGWRIAFRKYITLEKFEGGEVPVGIWQIDEEGERELDIIEDFPTMYRKEYVDIEINGKTKKALLYLINDLKPKFPDKLYFERLLIGYNDFKFDRKYLDEAVSRIPTKKVFIISNEEPINYVSALKLVGINSKYALKCENIDEFDGLLIPGGGDIDPKWYGQKNFFCRNVNSEQDKRVFETIGNFIKHKKAVLGICLGCQYLNVYFGGTLKQDIKDHKNTEHFVISKNSLFDGYFGKSFKVNSSHHQCVDKIGENLEIVGLADDGVVEAIMNKNDKILGVQWHPERILDKNGKDVFELFRTML